MKYGCEVPILKSLSFNPLGDERGSLVALEGGIDVPFDIKRVYYIFGANVCFFYIIVNMN